VTYMAPKTVEKLEGKVEEAIAEIIVGRADGEGREPKED
jgi:hypothetical protein